MNKILMEQYLKKLNESPDKFNDAFWKWFGDSKAVDVQGNPVVVYHGTNAIFSKFEKRKIGASNLYGNGFYFTEDSDIATAYIEKNKRYMEKKNPNVHSVYLSLQNPLDMDKEINTSELMHILRKSNIMKNLYWNHLIDEIIDLLSHLGYDISKIKDYERAYKDFSEYEIIKRSVDRQGNWYGGYSLIYENITLVDIVNMFNFIKDHNKGFFKFPPHNGKLNWQCLYYLLTDYNWSITNSEKLTKYFHKNYDGIKHIGGWNIGEKEHTVWVAFDSKQIKSVNNKGAWDSSSNNIYEELN